MNCGSRIAVVGGLVAVAVAARAGDWPQVRGPEHNGVSREPVRIAASWPGWGPKAVWEFKFPGVGAGAIDGATGPRVGAFRGAGSPVVSGGKVYVQAGCVDPSEMARVREKRRAVEARLADTPHDKWASDAEYAAATRAWAALKTYGFWCFDAKDGRLIWHKVAPADEGGGWFSCSTPSIANGKFYFFSRAGLLFCLSAGTGDELWRNQVAAKPVLGLHGYHGSPTVTAGSVVVNYPGVGTMALDATTGEKRWQRADVHSRHASPLPWTADGGPVVLCAGHCLTVDKGETLWKVPAWNDECQAALAGDRLAVVERTGNEWLTVVHRLTAKEAQLLFRKPVPNKLGGGALLDGDRAYWASFNLHCLDACTGDVRWKSELGLRNAFSAPVLVDGKIIGVTSGSMWMVDAVTGKTLAEFKSLERFSTRGSSLRAPAASGGRLYVVEDEKLVCYDLIAAGPPTEEWKKAQEALTRLADEQGRIPEELRGLLPTSRAGGGSATAPEEREDKEDP